MTETRNEPQNDPVPDAGECGLRERKRRETNLRLEDCATELILERGFDQVTIDEICEKADVSRRSFFNYFDSKDQVAAGRGVPPIPPDILETFATTDSGNIVRDVLRYIGTTLDNDPESSLRLSPDRTVSLRVRARRRQIVQETPILAAANMRRFDTLAGEILTAITEHLGRFPDRRHRPELSAEQEALLLTSIIREALAVGGILHREQPEMSKLDIFTRTGQQLTSLAAAYSDGWN